jgi:hypothetical protein
MSFFPLREPLQGGLSVERAEVVVAPRDKREWIKLQLLNINITNFTLIFAVLALAISINHTLDAQKIQNDRAQHALSELDLMLPGARLTAEWLRQNAGLLERFQNVSHYAQQLATAEEKIVQLQEQLSNVTSRTSGTQVLLGANGGPSNWWGTLEAHGGRVLIGYTVQARIYTVGQFCVLLSIDDGAPIVFPTASCVRKSSVPTSDFKDMQLQFPFVVYDAGILTPGRHKIALVRDSNNVEFVIDPSYDQASIVAWEVPL